MGSSTAKFAELCLPLRKKLLARARWLCRDHEHGGGFVGQRNVGDADEAADIHYLPSMAEAMESFSAEDLVQVTYLQALRDWDDFTENEEPSAQRAHHWLAGILYHRFIDNHRRASKRHKKILNYFYRAAPDFVPQEPESDLSERTKAALEILTSEHRDVVIRMYVVGDSYAKISADLGISIVTLKARLHRARRVLAPLLRP